MPNYGHFVVTSVLCELPYERDASINPVTTVEQQSCPCSCIRRKIKCDRRDPCSNCTKAHSECTHLASSNQQRHRKRVGVVDLHSTISEYESLMRRHNIKFRPLDYPWIPSPLEEKLPSGPRAHDFDAGVRVQDSGQAKAQRYEASGVKEQLNLQLPGIRGGHAPLWLGLPKHLREPAVEKLIHHMDDGTKGLDNFDSGIFAVPLIPTTITTAARLLESHPAPKHIIKLWQIFAEKVHPLTMVVHGPTLQHRIMNASWSLEVVAKPLEAVMFAVYALSITSMTPTDCIEFLGEPKSVLLSRFRTATLQALLNANLYATRDLEVLQALVLFALLDYHSEALITLTSLAVRIGHKMGLHRTGMDPQMPFFEQEMRLRVWWKLHCLETRARRLVGLPPPRMDFGDVRLPLNVNDAELDPRMTKRPAVEHKGTTEMLYCMMKYEIMHWIRTSPTIVENFANPLDMFRSTSADRMEMKKKALKELRQIYEDRYICHCDLSIPFHHISATLGRLSVHRGVFRSLHPRNQPEGGRLMSQAEQDEVFESSVQVLQLGYEVRKSQFSIEILEIQATKTQVDALVYIVSELRQRVDGSLVISAWEMVARMYQDYPELLQDDGKFFTGLADLTLDAWGARFRKQQSLGENSVPAFIRTLEAARGKTVADDISIHQAGMWPESGPPVVGYLQDESLDWEYWNEFLELS